MTISVNSAAGAKGNEANFVTDSSGNVVGLTAPSGGLQDPTIFARTGYRTVLAGDSMTEFNHLVQTPSSVSYSTSTGKITVSLTGHGLPVGATFGFWDRSYTSLYNKKRLTVESISSANAFVAALPSGDYSDLPNGALSGTCYVTPETKGCAKGWFTWLNAMCGQRFNIVANLAQSGDTAVEVLARVEEIAAHDPHVVVMQAPFVNSLTYDSIGSVNDFSAAMEALGDIFAWLRKYGIKALIGTATPVAAGESRAQKSIMQALRRGNTFVDNYARKYGGIILVDCSRYIVDPTSTTGMAKSGVLAAADHIHFTNVGGYKIAKGNKATVQSAFPSARSTLPISTLDSQANSALTSPTMTASGNIITCSATSSYIQKHQEVFVRGATGSYAVLNGRRVALGSDGSGSFRFDAPSTVPDGSVTGTLVVSASRNLFPDPLLQTTTGGTTSNGVTGTAAGQLSCSNGAGNTGTLSAVASVRSQPEGFGNEQIMTITAAAQNDAPRISMKNSVGTIENKLVAGRTYVFEALIRLTSTDWSATPISEIYFQTTIGANGGESWTAWDLNQYENVVPLESSGTDEIILHCRTAPITIPSFTTLDSCQAECRYRHQAAQSSETLIFGMSQIGFQDVTEDLLS